MLEKLKDISLNFSCKELFKRIPERKKESLMYRVLPKLHM